MGKIPKEFIIKIAMNHFRWLLFAQSHKALYFQYNSHITRMINIK
ncbi:uncharacterized protein METZ01_LOCUS380045 [marine metagenome]|uniref:Uncharacterized protein n=1 Tax=marine metagenome TaxID=408172 RepID=A0A382U0C3_9ZZZZ